MKKKRRKYNSKNTRKRKLRKFEETRLGFFLQHEVPVEYELLKSISEIAKIKVYPPHLIEAIAYASSDDFFKKQKFWRSLIEYRREGLRPKIYRQTNVRIELYYARRRKILLRNML